MALTVGDRPVRPLTQDEVLLMVEAGILGDDEPVELLHGVLTAVSAKTPGHEAVKLRLVRWLAAGAAAGRFDVRIEGPVSVPDRTSLPEPDVAVVQRDDTVAHPATALLVVEVAVSSLRVDTTIKPDLYAAAGVPEYWVVDVGERRLRVFSDPGPEGYTRTRAVREGTITPSAVEAEPLDIAALLAGL
jgi:Uma2 family endonuclease